MSVLFGRAWSLDIIASGKEKGARYGSEGLADSELRLTFDLERTLASNANKGKFTLYNLTPDNRNSIKQGATVILRAGYQETTGIIFQGFVRTVTVTQTGGDIMTAIDCGDGEPYITYGFVNHTFAETATLADVLEYICTRLNVTMGGQLYAVNGRMVQGLPNVSLPRYVLHGKVKHALDDLLKPYDVDWSIQCGSLLVQNKKGMVRLQATLLSADTGMIDVPTRTDTGVKFKSLLNPNIVPGSAVQISSIDPANNGNFRCIKCVYKGDTDAADWSVEVDASELLGPLAPVPTASGKQPAAQATVFEDPDEQEEMEDEQ